MYCRNCGHNIEDHVTFCPKCGTKVVIEKNTQSTYTALQEQKVPYLYVSAQNRTIAMLLCTMGFLGFAGLHRFYVGRQKTGALHLFTFGLFFLGTMYDLYHLYGGSFRDMDGYPLFDAAMMKENYRYRKPKFSKYNKITTLLCLLLFFGIIWTNIIQRPTHQLKERQETAVQQSAKSMTNAPINENIIQTVYIPKIGDHDAQTWYARIENTSNQRFKGRIKISNNSITDGAKTWIGLDLEPRESRFIAGHTPVPTDGKVESVIEGRFLDKVYEKSSSLDYHIIYSHLMGDGKLTHYEMYVYMPPNVPDDIYIKIAEEVNRNYGKSYALTTMRFVDVGVNPDISDTKVLFSRNNILKHCRIAFYTADETNTNLLPDGAPERKILNIER